MATPQIPRWSVPHRESRHNWSKVPPLPPLDLADGSGKPEQATIVRLCWDARALYVRFECEDRDAWATKTNRDDSLWEEEVVEVFLAAGRQAPVRYVEIEVNPLGALFDAWIDNPTSNRADRRVDMAWNCPGLRWEAGRGAERQDWWAELAIPLEPVAGGPMPPRIWRANFYRAERPRDGSPPELSSWSPILSRPVDFHSPARFGVLELSKSR